MTTPHRLPQEVLLEAFGHAALNEPDAVGDRALEALGAANFAVVHMPNTEPILKTSPTGVIRATIGTATARIDPTTGALRNVILDHVVCHNFEEAATAAQDLVAILAWARRQEGAPPSGDQA
jgi:hypothetical protein